MTREEIYALREQMQSADDESKSRARSHWDTIAKPLDGLGDLEQMIVKIAGMIGSPKVCIDQRAAIVMCADNGIVEEGVTQTGQEVTAAVAINMAKGKASIAGMCRYVGADLLTVDIGIKEDVLVPNLLVKKVAHGTQNFLKRPAMSEHETATAINCGIELVRECREKGYQILLTGEMGIGNTTTSTAVACALLGIEPEYVTGRGAGLSAEGLIKKQNVIRKGLEKYGFLSLKENPDPFDVLSCVGGLDLAGLTGVFIGGALYRIPVVIDGLISGAAALIAQRMFPGCKEFMLASHKGKEPALLRILEELDLSPIIDAKLKLGEGTGAAMLLPLLDMALCVYRENPSFDDIKLESYQRF